CSTVSAWYVPQDCLECICYVESSCCMLNFPGNPSGYEHCAWDVGSYSCGPYQIKEPYWIDARLYGGDLMGDWLTCTRNWACSEEAVHGYMRRYATESRLGYTPDCEDYSRIHNGGPNGHLNPATDPHWDKTRDCLIQNTCCNPYPPLWC
ncbi:invertebrate-type lysozyme-like, partial [Glandiceps talaboti]